MSADDAPELAFLLSGEADPPVTVVREIRVRRGSEAAFEDLMSRLIGEAVLQPGHLGATIVRPDPRRPGDAHRFVYKFDRRSRLDAWHSSDARARLFAPIEALIESDRFDAYPGLETWFDLPGAPAPPRWTRAGRRSRASVARWRAPRGEASRMYRLGARTRAARLAATASRCKGDTMSYAARSATLA